MKTAVILTFLVLVASTFPSNPSVIVRLNRLGWDFLRDTVLDLMQRKLPGMKIPPGGTDEEGLFTFTNKGGLIDAIALPTFGYSFDGNQVTIMMSHMYITARVWFKVVADFWLFDVSTSGWVQLRVTDLNAIASVNVILVDGRPQIVYNHCENSIRAVLITPHVSYDWAYRPFLGFIEDKVKGTVEEKVNDYIKMGIAQINAQLSTIPLQFELGSNFTLDYRFNEMKFDPNFSTASISGQLLYGKEQCLIEPKKPSDAILPNSMGHVWVSEQIGNCIFRSAHQGGIIQYTLTKDVPEAAPYLRTRCPFKGKNALCMGTFWPKLGEKFPKEYIDVHMHSFEEPQLNLTSGNARLGGSVLLDFYLHPMQTTKESLVTIKITSDSSIGIQINGTHLNGFLKDTNATIEQYRSDVGDIEPGSIASFRNLFVSVEEILLNGLLRQGIPIPIFKEAALALAPNSTINLLNDFVRLDANFVHQPAAKKSP